MTAPLLSVRSLSVDYPARGAGAARVRSVRDASFELDRGQTLGVVGESGSGKSTLALALLRLPASPARIAGGEVVFDGRSLADLPESQLRRLRGRRIAMILQDPLNSLNPLATHGQQIGEAPVVHEGLSWSAAWARAVDLLRAVRIADPALRAREYPHQISGGMRQRVAGAIALSCSPDLLVADEPTTALDPTVQAQYLDLLKALQAEHGFALMLISHDLGVIGRSCERVAVMYAGRVVELGDTRAVLARPAHPYTRALVGALPAPGRRAGTLPTIDGQPPDPARLPEGCAFAPRCPRAADRCRQAQPEPQVLGDGRRVECFFPDAR